MGLKMLSLFRPTFIIVALVALSAQVGKAQANLAPSASRLEWATIYEGWIIQELEAVVKTTMGNLEEIKRQIQVNKKVSAVEEGPESYVENPVNCFLLIKRLRKDWKQVQTLLTENIQKFTWIRFAMNKTFQELTEDDLEDAVMDVVKLQDKFKISATSIAQGKLPGGQSSHKITALDCLEIARWASKDDNMPRPNYHTMFWALEALRLLNMTDNANVQEDNGDLMDSLAAYDDHIIHYMQHLQDNLHVPIFEIMTDKELMRDYNVKISSRTDNENEKRIDDPDKMHFTEEEALKLLAISAQRLRFQEALRAVNRLIKLRIQASKRDTV